MYLVAREVYPGGQGQNPKFKCPKFISPQMAVKKLMKWTKTLAILSGFGSF